MNQELKSRINIIIKDIHELVSTCYPKHKFSITYLTIFSQSDEDFSNLRKNLLEFGIEEQSNNGYKYRLNTPFKELNEEINLVRIRKPDIHRKEFGCTDLSYNEDDYMNLRSLALDQGLDIILRKGYEMIELSDFNINVYAYLIKDI